MAKSPMVLAGDVNVPAMPMSDAEVNHLRRLLAWMRCEYTLDDNMLAGCLDAATKLVAGGSITPERGQRLLEERAARVNQVPIYVRQGVKMLTKALREHEKRAGVVEASSPDVQGEAG